jgi:hypothetical protein
MSMRVYLRGRLGFGLAWLSRQCEAISAWWLRRRDGVERIIDRLPRIGS